MLIKSPRPREISEALVTPEQHYRERRDPLSRPVSDAELEAAVAHWRTHGWARLPAVALEGSLALLRARAEAIVAGTSGFDGFFFQPDAPTGRYADLVFGHGYAGPEVDYRKIEKLEHEPAFRAWLEQPLFRRLVVGVLGPRVSLYRATLFWKAPLVGSDLPFHQDCGRFWGLDRDPELQLWTALDDASVEAGCLVVVPGSHLAGLATPLGGIVPEAMIEASGAALRELPVPACAGDVLLLHNCLWHRSGGNRTARPRRAFTVAYLHGDTRCRRRKRAPRQFLRLFT